MLYVFDSSWLYCYFCNFRIKSSVIESSALNDSYGDNTFVDESTMATSRDKVSKKSPRSPLEKLNKQKINIPLAGRDFKTRRHGNRGRSSESESEESISHTGMRTPWIRGNHCIYIWLKLITGRNSDILCYKLSLMHLMMDNFFYPFQMFLPTLRHSLIWVILKGVWEPWLRNWSEERSRLTSWRKRGKRGGKTSWKTRKRPLKSR